jgi:putative sigma-54 modulation protein
MAFSLRVKSSFEFSPALSAHIERRIDHALRAHAAHINCVVLRLSDVNGPRHGADDKLTRIDITLNPSGNVVTSARSDDVYVSVTRAALRARAALRRRVEQLDERARPRRWAVRSVVMFGNQTAIDSFKLS